MISIRLPTDQEWEKLTDLLQQNTVKVKRTVNEVKEHQIQVVIGLKSICVKVYQYKRQQPLASTEHNNHKLLAKPQ